VLCCQKLLFRPFDLPVNQLDGFAQVNYDIFFPIPLSDL
jgi:hypothetical protein